MKAERYSLGIPSLPNWTANLPSFLLVLCDVLGSNFLCWFQGAWRGSSILSGQWLVVGSRSPARMSRMRWMASWFVGRDTDCFLDEPLLKSKNCYREAATMLFPSFHWKKIQNWPSWEKRSAALARATQISAVAWLNWEVWVVRKTMRGEEHGKGIYTGLKCMHWSRIKCTMVLFWGGGESFSLLIIQNGLKIYPKCYSFSIAVKTLCCLLTPDGFGGL